MYMADNQSKNKARAAGNKNELWMANHLKTTGVKWTPQARWGFRIFDFWCAKLGIAVEVDGPEHDHEWDSRRDAANYAVSGILVLRVKNKCKEDAFAVLEAIATSETWNERRKNLGMKIVSCGK